MSGRAMDSAKSSRFFELLEEPTFTGRFRGASRAVQHSVLPGDTPHRGIELFGVGMSRSRAIEELRSLLVLSVPLAAANLGQTMLSARARRWSGDWGRQSSAAPDSAASSTS